MTAMDYPARRNAEERLERISQGITRWVLGPGLLSVHVGVYLVSLVALLLWNFARTPNDVWVDGPFRRWGLVVVFHGTAVAAGWAAWRLMRLGTAPEAPGTPAAPGRSWTSSAAAASTMDAQTGASRNAVAAATAEEWARRWLRQSVRVVREAVVPGGTANGSAGDGVITGAAASAVAGPEITEWGTLFARRAREVVSSARDHLSPGAPRVADGSTAPNGPGTGPASTWPGGESGQHAATEAVQPMSPAGTWPAPVGGSVHPGAIPGFAESHGPAVPEPDSDLDPSETAATTEHGRRDDAATEDARWNWVEAAAAAWLARREVDDPAENQSEAPPPGDESTATP
jgi:hypothetical protein